MINVRRFPAISAPRLAPAIPPPTITTSKSTPPVTNWKALPSRGGVMFNGAFTQALLVALAAILVFAAVIDVRTFTISNRLNLTVALLAPLYWASIALSPWPGVAIQLAAGVAGFFCFCGAVFSGARWGGAGKATAAPGFLV